MCRPGKEEKRIYHDFKQNLRFQGLLWVTVLNIQILEARHDGEGRLELQQVRLVTALQGEGGGQVLFQQWGFLNLRQQSGIDGLLVSHLLGLDLFLWLFFVEEVGFGLLGLRGLLSGKVSNVVLGHVNTRNVNLGGGSDHVTSVNSSQWHTVDLEWTSHQQGVVLQVLQVHNSLTSESTGKENQHGTWGDRGTQLVRTLGLSSDLWSLLVSISCVEEKWLIDD